ncbi:MAG: histidine phosphatase family protein [Phenylobacterium sp.]|uniref:histidine phosphatase family protein n=1 Tax=Phenylobacterium sp. TaxID=1871053 RepID=UPI0027367E0A|nr:histidine phosphatase family protein [Phenylobacterium sp.]MDP3747920.1 histidine phosphatase family protein [Phenylobacterium sp.]
MRTSLIALAAALISVAPAYAQTIVIVRHGEKADASSDPALSSAGEARALALASALKAARVTAVIATPLKRTRSTAQPTAAAAGLTVTNIGFDGGQPTHVAAVTALARQAPATATVLVVGHSNTVPEIARALGDADPQPLTECDFDRMTVIQLGAGAPKVVHARYGAPTSAC